MSRPKAPSRLTPDLLLQAYRIGYFPMAEDRTARDVFWVRPDVRGVLPLEAFHLPRSLRKVIRQDQFEVRVDTDFAGTISACAAATSMRPETWINDQIIDAYTALHRLGHAHSVEAYANGQLVGGLYGVRIGSAFFGESMFSLATDASKVAFAHLVARLRVGGFTLLDTQFQNDHIARFGVMEMPAADYSLHLAEALARNADFFALPRQARGSTILQSITQTS